jgi:ribosomal protein S18 acetylase RimI-like enzyme
MLVTEPGLEEPELEQGLVIETERYLRRRGASVLYAGGQYPLNPFYWGVYGGSEWAGILAGHTTFQRAVARAGYEPVSTTVLLETDFSAPEVRDSRSFLIRRHARIEVTEDASPADWWEALTLGNFPLTAYRLVKKDQECELARATTWDMSRFDDNDGRPRLGLIHVEVHPDHRRQGYGRYLVGEILHQARVAMAARVFVQASALNHPALALYESLGFARSETATLYRLPAGYAERSL